MQKPEPFIRVQYHEQHKLGYGASICAGFERGRWREQQLVEHTLEWLPEFALPYSELVDISYANAVRKITRAARSIYNSEKYKSRGEFGEIFLHIAIRQLYETIPAISKIFFKSSVNKTVEGFDSVHVVATDSTLELWIGETKFYASVRRAIADVTQEIVDHLHSDYLRDEFLLIQNKIDPAWPYADRLTKLLDENTSLDEVFDCSVIPVLLTYDSDAVGSYGGDNDEYKKELIDEFSSAISQFEEQLVAKYERAFTVTLPVTVHLILFPVSEKASLNKALDARLKGLQG